MPLRHLPVFLSLLPLFYSQHPEKLGFHFVQLPRKLTPQPDREGEACACWGGWGGVKEEIAEGTRGCILGIQLNEAVCFLGNHLYRCQTTHPSTPPPTPVINEYSLSNKEAHIPTTQASPACFHTFFRCSESCAKGRLCYWVEAFSLRV